MTLLRRVLGDTLRGRRLRQRRTLREVSGAARVSLGYLSEVERGQKEASSELLASICEALDVKLSDLLREVSETMRRSERAAEVRRVPGRVILPAPDRRPVPAGVGAPGPSVGGPVTAEGFDEEFDAEAFAEVFEEDFRDGPDPDPLGTSDSVPVPSPTPAGPTTRSTGAAAAHSTGAPATRSTGTPAARSDSAPVAGSTGASTAGPAGALAARPAGAPVVGPAGAPAALPAGAPVVWSAGLPGEDAGLDGVDLADLETGDGLGDLEVLLSLTDLTTPRCLAAA